MRLLSGILIAFMLVSTGLTQHKRGRHKTLVEEFISMFNFSGASVLAGSCYNKLDYSGYMVQHCVISELLNWGLVKHKPTKGPSKYFGMRGPLVSRKPGVKRPPLPHSSQPNHSPQIPRNFNSTRPTSCYAFRTIAGCINDFACQVCTNEEGQAFQKLQDVWQNKVTTLCKAVTYPENVTSVKLCQPTMFRSSANATWGTVRPIPMNNTELYVSLGVLLLVILVFVVICVLISRKKPEPLVLDDQPDGMVLQDANPGSISKGLPNSGLPPMAKASLSSSKR